MNLLFAPLEFCLRLSPAAMFVHMQIKCLQTVKLIIAMGKHNMQVKRDTKVENNNIPSLEHEYMLSL